MAKNETAYTKTTRVETSFTRNPSFPTVLTYADTETTYADTDTYIGYDLSSKFGGKLDNAFTATAPAETAFSDVAKVDTNYLGNPSYTSTDYDTARAYNVAAVYNGLGLGVSRKLQKPETSYT